MGPSSLALISCVILATLGCRNVEKELVSTNCADIFLGPTNIGLESGHISLTLYCLQLTMDSPSPTQLLISTSLQQGKGPLPQPFPSTSSIFYHKGSSLIALLHLHTLIHIVSIFLKSLLLPKSCSFLGTLNKSYFLKPMSHGSGVTS